MSGFITDDVREAGARDLACSYFLIWEELSPERKHIWLLNSDAALHGALPLLEKAIRADEREKCALACLGESLGEVPDNDPDQAYNQAVNDCAAAIRARGE